MDRICLKWTCEGGNLVQSFPPWCASLGRWECNNQTQEYAFSSTHFAPMVSYPQMARALSGFCDLQIIERWLFCCVTRELSSVDLARLPYSATVFPTTESVFNAICPSVDIFLRFDVITCSVKLKTKLNSKQTNGINLYSSFRFGSVNALSLNAWTPLLARQHVLHLFILTVVLSCFFWYGHQQVLLTFRDC